VAAVDQCLSSVSNFAVGVVVARVAGVSGFGAFSLAYAMWLVLAACHRSLVTDPMAIENDLHADKVTEVAEHVRMGLAAELTLGIASALVSAAIGTVLVAVGEREFGTSFLVLAPWLPFLLAQDYWRWVGYMKGQPHKALANDVVFDVVQAVLFGIILVVGVRSSAVAICAWGLGAAAGAVYGLWQFSSRPSLAGGIERIKGRWKLSKWLLAGAVSSQVTSQSTVVLTSAFLGPSGIGGLKAALNLVAGPSLVLIQAGGSIGLPEASKGLKERGWSGLRRVQRIITVAGFVGVGLIAVVVFAFGAQLLSLVYGPAFGKFASTADVLAVAELVCTLSLGAMLSLKATRQTKLTFPATAVSLVISVVAIVILAPRYGVLGSAYACLTAITVRTGILVVTHWKYSRRAAESLLRPVAGPPAPAPPSVPQSEVAI